MPEPTECEGAAVIVYTIGFAGKTAREFFTRLTEAGVKRVIDVRHNNVSQLAGFTKKDDLAYFLEQIAGIGYTHRPDLAPTKEILSDYRKKVIDWETFERRFGDLMVERGVETLVTPADLDQGCLLCSESEPDRCHRRLLVEYLRERWRGLAIRHL